MSAAPVTAGAIYIIRNPLDVAISYAHHLGQSIDAAIELMHLKDAETTVTDTQVYELYGSWSQHVLSWTRKPHRAIYVMRYEDMLAEPQKTFGALARHLLFTPSESELADAIDRSDGRAGQWKEVLTPQQVQRIVDAHGEQMRRFGYLPL